MTNHLPLVEHYFATEFEDVIPSRVVAAVEWDATVDRVHTPFGYLPGDVTLICPEMIARQVAHIADDQVVLDYLMYVAHHVFLHAVHYMLPSDELERLVDRVTYDCDPRSAALGNEIQARALDGTHA